MTVKMRSHKLTWGAHWSGWWLRSGRWCQRFPSRCSGPLCSGSALAVWGHCSLLWSCLQTQAAPLATSQITASGSGHSMIATFEKYTQLRPARQPTTSTLLILGFLQMTAPFCLLTASSNRSFYHNTYSAMLYFWKEQTNALRRA